ncbi:hypothetical protein QBC42DRAFT_263615 [Cladorrhinum samala]|uniref:Uncharacterized protein n=1 Tax=Cladorrhinum samala TaxID=585594 RepID=A0AAV9HZ54_9PEZI|nr:hypothetical protein QBC42DRAFT_263615 [Cladorrhinum samala]
MAEYGDLFGDDLFGDSALGEENADLLASPNADKSGPSFSLTLPTLPEKQTQAEQEEVREPLDLQFTPAHTYPEPPQQSPQTIPDFILTPSFFAPTQVAYPYTPLLNPASTSGVPSKSPTAAVHEGKKLTHDRKNKYKDNDPSSIYDKPKGLGPWGPLTQERFPQPMFQYNNSFAELQPYKTYTKDGLISFFMGIGHPNPARNLTLFIQNTPAQSNHRYVMGPSSGKCRYRHCPAPLNTILTGFWRVAFDEFSDQTGTLLDPFHNAGYMHLHCFEELFDLGYLIHYGASYHSFSIRADVRHFPYESRNPMSISRDQADIVGAYNSWVQEQKHRCDQLHLDNITKPPNVPQYDGFHPSARTPHKYRLGYRLTLAQLSADVKTRALTREKRGGAHMGKHKGDLNLYVRLRKQGFSEKKRKRAVEDEEEKVEEEEEEEEAEVQIIAVVPKNRQRREPIAPLTIPSRNSIAAAAGLPSAVPKTPVGPRTRQRSRQLESTFVEFLNRRSFLTRSEAHEIQERLGGEPEHVQENVLAAVGHYWI